VSDPRRNRARLVIGALIAAVAITGCGAGQITQTARQVAAVEGANATAGPIAVRNAMIEFDEPAHGAVVYPAGGNAPLQMVIANSGAQVDRLVAASSPVATSVQVSGVLRIPGGQSLRIEGAPAEAVAAAAPAEGAPAGPGAVPTAEPTAEPTEAPAAGAPAAEAPEAGAAPAEQPAAGDPAAAVEQPPTEESGVGHIVLTGLREDVQPGLTYPLVLTFERAGEVRVDVPVESPDTLRAEAAH